MLDNTPNNNTTLAKLKAIIGFDLKQKRLRYIGHVLNLIAKAYFYKQKVSNFQKKFKDIRPLACKKMWRDYRELGKLYNLVAYVIASSKRTDLFLKLQKTKNIGIAASKR